MTKNTQGRHKILITLENIEKVKDPAVARNLLNDFEQYEFDSLESMHRCASVANVKLSSFTEACARPPHHGYENEEFLQNQVEGITPRFYVEKEPEKLDDIAKAVSGPHYNDIVPGFQYMEMMEYMLNGKSGVESHLLGQVYKYLIRAGKKDDVEQEYRKARWYLNALVKFKQTGKVDCEGND
jgi:hypothetical protein